MKHLKISIKLMIGFGLAIALAALIGIIGILGLKADSDRIELMYNSNILALEYSNNVGQSFQSYRSNLRNVLLYSIMGDFKEAEASKAEADINHRNLIDALENYNSTINTDDERKIYDDFIDNFAPYKLAWDGVIEDALRGSVSNSMRTIESVSSHNSALNSAITAMAQINAKMAEDTKNESLESSEKITLTLFGILIASIIVAVILATYISRSITNPINNLIELLRRAADGDLSIDASSNSRDEVGILTRSVGQVVTSISKILYDIERVSDEIEKGDIDARIPISGLHGDYQKVTIAVDMVIAGLVDNIMLALEAASELEKGNFGHKIKLLPGKKIILNKTFDSLQNNLLSLSSDIKMLISEASVGNLDATANADNYQGDWNELVKGLNNLLATIAEPVKRVSHTLDQVSKANLSVRINESYKGEFGVMKDALNSTIENTSMYIKDISYILGEIAKANLNLSVEKDYIGDFVSIKNAVITILDRLNGLLGQIDSSTEQVSDGAKNISDSSMALANGATEQASAVQELSATIDTINEQTRKNAENSTKANELSENSRRNALAGNDEMKRMLDSMDGIKDSSNNISKIIRTIEDIAFQTNLLALNAAVEAARAGEHGKGFAVVAEEVRRLAVRSQSAAKETTAMIEDSISRVNHGTEIAKTTAESLETIVRDVNKVSGIISQISKASHEQAEAIQQVTIGLGRISDVVQNNSSTSEDSAAASEELSGQSETLKNMVSVFKLRT